MTIPHSTGTVSVTAGSDVVTGTGTSWNTPKIYAMMFGLDSSNGNPVPVAEIISDTELRLAKPWRGATAAGQAYWMTYDTRDGQQTVGNAIALSEYIQRLANQMLAALAGVVPVADSLILLTGPDSATTIPLAGLINGADYDVQVNDLAGRAAYNGSVANYRVLVSDVGDGRSAIYSKRTAASGDWTTPAYVTGPGGQTGSTPTIAATAVQLAAGVSPTAIIAATETGVTIQFGIPAARTSGFPYRWSTTVTDANPGNGFIRANNANLAAATLLYVSKTSQAGSAMAAYLLAMASSTNTTSKGDLLLQRMTDGQTVSFSVTGVTDATNYVKVAITGQSGLTALANNVDLNFQFTRAGNKGNDGLDGAGAGTVTSVGLSVPTGLSVDGSPISSSGTFTMTWASGYQAYTGVEASKLAGIGAGANVVSVAGKTGVVALARADVGLSNAAELTVEDQVLTGGARVTSKSLGTLTTGTLTLDPGDRPLQHYTNNGAHTLAPGTNTGSFMLDITNGASAGAVTVTGWTKVMGDAFTTTSGNKFRLHCSIGSGGSLLIVQALQ